MSEEEEEELHTAAPDSGVTAPFSKDVINQAKNIYIRPLQSDIT